MKKHYEWRIGNEPPSIGEHSLGKHRIIDRYIRRYIEICTSTPVQEKLNLTIVDGFSGGGLYRFGDDELPGSPMILLRAVADLQEKLNAQRKKGFRIQTDFIFIDEKPHHTEYLREEIKKSPFVEELDKSVQIWTGDFNERVDDAIQIAKRRSRKGRSIFLLDQYGWSNVAFDSVRRILGSLEKAEVFLNFSVDSLINYITDKRILQDSHGRIGVNSELLDQLLSAKDKGAGQRTLIQNVLYEHIQEQTGAEFYSPFFIKSPKSHRSYWFIHLSRHREARNEIGNIHWSETNTSMHHGGPGLRALGFAPGVDPAQLMLGYEFNDHAKEQSKAELLKQIPESIFEAVNSDLAPSLEDLFGAHCNDTPVTREMYESVLKELRELGEVRIEDAYGSEKPRSQTVNWTDRIVLSRQPSFFGPFGPLKT